MKALHTEDEWHKYDIILFFNDIQEKQTLQTAFLRLSERNYNGVSIEELRKKIL